MAPNTEEWQGLAVPSARLVAGGSGGSANVFADAECDPA